VIGIDCHIGSQLTDIAPFVDALQRLMVLVETLQQKGIHLQHIDIGGGLGVRYSNETPPTPKEYVQALNQVLGNTPYEIIVEPGRAIAANAGILLTKVEYLKKTANKHFAIVDAAMNDLIRPAADFLGKNRSLALREGDLLAVRTCGAYGFTMSSNYNTRPRAIELMVDGEHVTVVRQRETVNDLLALENV